MKKNLLEQLKNTLKTYIDSKHGGVSSEAAKSLGISPALLHKWLLPNDHEDSRSPTIRSIEPLLEKLEISIVFPNDRAILSRLKTHSPNELVQGGDLQYIPILGEAGAGSDIEVFSENAEATLPILSSYHRPNMWAVRVKGDSMEPLIRNGAYVGVVPLDGELIDGDIYLVRIPPFGYVVKRVRMDEQGQIVLHSENPLYKPQIVPLNGYEDIIVARVLWSWQQYS